MLIIFPVRNGEKSLNHISIKSYAKINLGLDVTGVLENGYHTVKMVMQNISLYDSLYFEKRTSPKITLKTNLAYLPTNEKNIVYAAIQLFREEFHISNGIYANIVKKIPVAAGMAGGSGNAAATLKALDRLFGTKMSDEKLAELGLRLGADVPYCLMGGTALAEGIGEKLTRLPAPPQAKVLIVKPDISVSTQMVYKNLRLDDKTVHPDIDATIAAIKTGSLRDMCGTLGNVLEDVTVSLFPCIRDIKQRMLLDGAEGALMSGSGPTVFGLFSDEEAAVGAYNDFLSDNGTNSVFLCDFYEG